MKTTALFSALLLCSLVSAANNHGQGSYIFSFDGGCYKIYEEGYPDTQRNAMELNFKYYCDNNYVDGKSITQIFAEGIEHIWNLGEGSIRAEQNLLDDLCLPKYESVIQFINEKLSRTSNANSYSITSFSFIYSRDGILRYFSIYLKDKNKNIISQNILTEEQFKSIFLEVRANFTIQTWSDKILYVGGVGTLPAKKK